MRPPKLLKPYVLSFARRVARDAAAAPFYVASRPAPNTKQGDCFITVEEHVAKHGGSGLLGWAIWERPNVFLEAEFHMIWIQPDGSPLDIVSRDLPIRRILFVKDAQRRYAGRQIDNIRKALNHDRDVKCFLGLMAERFAILNEGDLADYHGRYTPSQKLARVEREAKTLDAKITNRYGPWEVESI